MYVFGGGYVVKVILSLAFSFDLFYYYFFFSLIIICSCKMYVKN